MPDQDPYSEPSPFKELTRKQRQDFAVAVAKTAIGVDITLAILYGSLLFSDPSWQLAIAAGQGVITVPLCLLTLRLIRQGKTELGTYILLPWLLFLTGLLSIILGLVPVIAVVYVALIVGAGMVFRPIGSYIIATVAAVFWLVAFFSVGIRLSAPSPLSGLSATVVIVLLTEVSFFLVAYLSQAATSLLWKALDDTAYDLIEANRQLDEANKHKSQFLARMSHDLRTPLTSIILSSDLTLRQLYGPLTEKQDHVQKQMLSSARRLKLLIDDILDISKIEAGELQLVEEEVEVKSLVASLKNTLEPRAHEKGLDFSVSIANTTPAVVLGDQARLLQILTNLTENAIKFTEQGEINILIDQPEGHTWRMQVSDTGRGIREADMDKIFEEFHQVDATRKDRLRGSGLGLAIAHQLVKLMKGQIQVKSRLGKGSTFEVRLPLKVNGKPGISNSRLTSNW